VIWIVASTRQFTLWLAYLEETYWHEMKTVAKNIT